MAKDYTKYNVSGVGEKLNKRKLVFAIIEDYAKKTDSSFEEMKRVFPDSLQGSTIGLLREDIDRSDANRFFREPIILKDTTTIRVSNQWGLKNISTFIAHAETLGYVIQSLGQEESNLSRGGSDTLTADFMLKTDSKDIICSLKNFVVNMSDDNTDLQNYYERIKEEGRASACLFASALIRHFERELYFEFLTRSIPSGSTDRYQPTIEMMQEEEFDWFEICPHIVLTRIGEFDLTPIVCFDENDEFIVKQCTDIYKEYETDFDPDYLWDYISDYECAARFSVDDDLFKEVAEEL